MRCPVGSRSLHSGFIVVYIPDQLCSFRITRIVFIIIRIRDCASWMRERSRGTSFLGAPARLLGAPATPARRTRVLVASAFSLHQRSRCTSGSPRCTSASAVAPARCANGFIRVFIAKRFFKQLPFTLPIHNSLHSQAGCFKQ